MGTNTVEQGMLATTLDFFRNTSQGSFLPAQGTMLLDGWLQALQGDPNLDQLTGQLTELHSALQAAQPDEPYIRQLMASLADMTQAIAEGPNAEGTWTGGLESLSKILRHLSNPSS